MSRIFHVLLLVLLSARAAAGDRVPAAALSADATCDNKDGAGCALNALQRAITPRGELEGVGRQQREEKSALCFAGGGYRAMTSFFGTLTAMVSVLSDKLGCNATVKELVVNADTFASNSGGGWFLSQLIYSPRFEAAMIAGARDPDQAQEAYDAAWTTPFMDWALQGEIPTAFLEFTDQLYQAEHEIHHAFLSNGVPMKLLSSTIGLALHSLRSAGHLDDEMLALVQPLLLGQLPCSCLGMALSRGQEPEQCECNSPIAKGDDFTMALAEVPGPGAIANLLKLAPTILGMGYRAMRGISENLKMFWGIYRRTRLDWTNIIEGMLEHGSGISPNTHFGTTNVNAFAKGKLWMAAVSLCTPGGRHKGWEVNAYSTRMNRVTYVAKGDNPEFNLYTMGKISVIVGAGLNSSIAHPVCSNRECHGFYSMWRSTARIPFVVMKKDSAKWGPMLERGTKIVGDLLLGRVVSSSSAAMGFSVFSNLYKAPRFTATWIVDSAHPYDKAEVILARAEGRGDLTTFRTLRDFANWNLLPIIDGVVSDNTGVASALATGHTDITAHPTFHMQNIEKLFSNYFDMTGKKAEPEDVFQLGGLPYMEVFADDAQAMRDAAADFPVLEAVESLFLKTIQFGTFNCTTTDNPWAGVTAGTAVKLHVVLIVSKAGIQGENSFWLYGQYIEDVAKLLTAPSSREIVMKALDEFYLGLGGRAAPTSCSS